MLGRGLLIAEVALACTLLVGATLLTRSFVNLTSAERGLDTAGVTVLYLNLSEVGDSGDDARFEVLLQTIEDELRAFPGVQQVASSYGLPPRGGGGGVGEWTADLPGASPIRMEVSHYRVSPDFFSLYGIPITRGRNLSRSDPYTDVIVSETLAETLWPGADPVGRTYRFAQEFGRIENGEARTELAEAQVYRVVGLAREIHYPAVSSPRGYDGPELYSLYTPFSLPMVSLRCEPVCEIPVIRHRLASAFPAVGVQSAWYAESYYAAALVRPRVAATLALVFAAVAILAAATGLFSVLSYTVNSRRREFGIRVALGASPAEIRRVVFRDGLAVTLVGLIAGAIIALLLARVLSALLFEVSAFDPLSFLVVLAAIGLTAILAVWRPASIAGHVDPVRLLRTE